MLTTYFGGLGDNLETALALPVAGLHVDLVRAPDSSSDVVIPCTEGSASSRSASSTAATSGAPISPPRLNGSSRSIAEPGQRPGADRAVMLAAARPDRSRTGNRSRSRREKLAGILRAEDRGNSPCSAQALAGSGEQVADALAASEAAAIARKTSPRIHNASVARAHGRQSTKRCADATAYSPNAPACSDRGSTCPHSRPRRSARFPQTAEVRNARAAHGKGAMTDAQYEQFLQEADGARRALAGGDRPRRARARRVRAQRHGAVFRRATCRVSPSPGTAGCNPTVRATSGRRSCSATSPVPSR